MNEPRYVATYNPAQPDKPVRVAQCLPVTEPGERMTTTGFGFWLSCKQVAGTITADHALELVLSVLNDVAVYSLHHHADERTRAWAVDMMELVTYAKMARKRQREAA